MLYTCQNGTCGSCNAKLIDGKVNKFKHHDYVLTAKQKHNKEFLMCCNSPASDINIEVDLIDDVKSIAIQVIETKIKSIVFVDDSLCLLTLRTPRSKTLQFMAGQDVELSFEGLSSRYPIASCPCNGLELEFHIRNSPGDDFASAIYSNYIKPKTSVALKGPKGIFVLKELSKRPMLFIAWDIGFAPIRSLIEHSFSLEMLNPVSLYWAYSENEPLPYLDNHAKSWQVILDNYSYTKIPCSFNNWNDNDFNDIANEIFNNLDIASVVESDVYISAPAEILIYLGELLLDIGLSESQIIASPV